MGTNKRIGPRRQTLRVFLADLGHNQVTVSSDVYPLGIADLAAFATEHLNGKVALDITLYREPQHLAEALKAGTPDVLGVSSYAWNHELARQFVQHAKALAPGVLTLLGGPNFPLTAVEQEQYLRSLPEIDVAVRGQTYEAEVAFSNILRRFAEVGRSLEGLWEESVPGNMCINRRTGEFVAGETVGRIQNLDEIPSPYLNGWMEPFFSTGYFPLLQISRGCPFSCTFCNSSVSSNSKIYSHSLENVQADLLYIAQRVKPEIPVCFADDNFGMYGLDEEVADYIAYLQETYGWPKYIRTTTGKNRHERIIRVMRKTRGAMPMTSAVQSLNPDVLKNIKRSNIQLSAYAAIQEEVERQGMQSYGELILCLPGETRESFMKAVSDLLQSGVKRVSAHQLMLLHGAPLSNPESRQKWGFDTRWRVVARNIGRYLEEPVVEVEEVVMATSSFSFEDYLETRVFHLLLTIFFYEGNYDEAFAFARQHGISAFDLVVKLQSLLPVAPEAFQRVVGDFLSESRSELFQTKEECLAWAKENFQGLVEGSVGGNLLSKYSMIGRFYTLHESLDLLRRAVVELLPGTDAEVTEQLDAITEYLRAVMLHAPFATTLKATPGWNATYDVEAWRVDKYVRPLAHYRLEEPRLFATGIDSDVRHKLEVRLATFGDHPAGLGKFTRTMFARELRRTVTVAQQP